MKHTIHIVHKEITTHPFDYSILTIAGFVTFLAISMLRGERLSQFYVLTAFVLFYIGWGFHHHYTQKTLRFPTMLEYVLIGFTLLFCSVLLFLL